MIAENFPVLTLNAEMRWNINDKPILGIVVISNASFPRRIRIRIDKKVEIWHV